MNGLRDTISGVSHLSKEIFVENTTPSALIDIDNFFNSFIFIGVRSTESKN